jgi:hypothetical protein
MIIVRIPREVSTNSDRCKTLELIALQHSLTVMTCISQPLTCLCPESVASARHCCAWATKDTSPCALGNLQGVELSNRYGRPPDVGHTLEKANEQH